MHLLNILGYFRRGSKYSKYSLDFKRRFTTKIKPPWNIMFFGTDDFSLYSLKTLSNELYYLRKKGIFLNNLEVVTSFKAKNNSVYKYAVKENLKIHNWPLEPVGTKFDIGVVVSFGHLIPEEVINYFEYGILNIHASLLPRWRGAAPIIHAIANQDSVTGITIMRIEPHKFDVGDIVTQESVTLSKHVTMPELYHVLAKLGAKMLMNCICKLPHCLNQSVPQPSIGVTYAPKVSWQMGIVNFTEMTSEKICALGRALYGLYPLTSTWNNMPVKLYDICISRLNIDNSLIEAKNVTKPGFVIFDKKTEQLYVQCSDYKYVSFTKVGIAKKKPMTAKDFNNGYLKKQNVQFTIFR